MDTKHRTIVRIGLDQIHTTGLKRVRKGLLTNHPKLLIGDGYLVFKGKC